MNADLIIFNKKIYICIINYAYNSVHIQILILTFMKLYRISSSWNLTLFKQLLKLKFCIKRAIYKSSHFVWHYLKEYIPFYKNRKRKKSYRSKYQQTQPRTLALTCHNDTRIKHTQIYLLIKFLYTAWIQITLKHVTRPDAFTTPTQMRAMNQNKLSRLEAVGRNVIKYRLTSHEHTLT